MDRRRFLAAASFAAGVALESAVDWRFAPAQAATLAGTGDRRVTDVDVAAVRAAYGQFAALDTARGGGHVLGWLQQYLAEDVTPLLHGRYTDATGKELFRAAAALTDMAGWMAMDCGHQGLAQRLYTQAAGLATHAGDTVFGAVVFGNLATQALYLGHTRTAIRLARAARDGAGRHAPATLIARITVTEARAHALLGDRHETRRTLRAAEQAVQRATPDTDPEWLAGWSHAHYSGGVMHALRDVGAVDEAARHADAALALPGTKNRTRGLHTVLYATVLAERGDLDGAVANASTALDTSRTCKSTRLVKRLKEFDALLAPHRHVPVVADYRDRAAAVLATSR